MSDESQATLRDDLALVRTDLANERTLLAYGRTALMIIATGISMIKFFPDSPSMRYSGVVFAMCGGLVGAIGVYRFVRLRSRLH